MDPEEIYERLMRAAYAVVNGEARPGPDLCDEIAHDVAALDEWLRGGGFLPRAWLRMGRQRRGES